MQTIELLNLPGKEGVLLLFVCCWILTKRNVRRDAMAVVRESAWIESVSHSKVTQGKGWGKKQHQGQTNKEKLERGHRIKKPKLPFGSDEKSTTSKCANQHLPCKSQKQNYKGQQSQESKSSSLGIECSSIENTSNQVSHPLNGLQGFFFFLMKLRCLGVNRPKWNSMWNWYFFFWVRDKGWRLFFVQTTFCAEWKKSKKRKKLTNGLGKKRDKHSWKTRV